MDAIFFLLALFVVPAIIGLLALRFAPDSRPGFQTKDYTMAATGMAWDESTTPAGEPKRRIAIPAAEHPFPTLQAIDQACGSDTDAFATDLHAASLEHRARALTGEYWPNSVWLLGFVSQSQLDAVVSRLNAERDQLRRDVRIFVAPGATGVPARA